MKKVKVIFHPSTDTKLFVQSSYFDVKNYGLILTDLNLIHCAMIHYQSRFKSSLSRRFRYTYDTIEPSIVENRSDNFFYFDDGEKSELQTQSSEVIGVGFAIALFQKLFDVNFNNINEIIGSAKRCDFEINYRGRKIIAESKGRKNGKEKAIKEILNQKSAYPSTMPKYGAISMLKRDKNPVEIIVVDPPSIEEEINREENILNLLIHYTKAAQLSGYRELALLMNHRIDLILKKEKTIRDFENNNIVYRDNLEKLGYEVVANIGNHEFSSFFANNPNHGFNIMVKNELKLFFAIDKKMKKILEDQDFNSLLAFRGDYESIADSNSISIHNDGTCIILTENNSLEEAMHSKKNELYKIFNSNTLLIDIKSK